MKGWRWTVRIKGGPGSGNWGHAGRPGKVGGSAPGGGLHRVMGSSEAPLAAERGRQISEYYKEIGEADAIGYITDEKRGEIKNALVEAISEEARVEYEQVNRLIKQWAYSSNDRDMRSLNLQVNAAKEFGVPLSDYTRSRIEQVKRETPSQGDQTPSYRMKQRDAMRAMYEITQRKLRDMGIGPDDKVSLWRGTGYHQVPGAKSGERIRFKGNTLESWSTNKDLAHWFGSVLIRADVPAKMILCLSTTGFGCIIEGEVVLIGGHGVAEVIDAR